MDGRGTTGTVAVPVWLREPARPQWLREREWAGWAAVVAVCFGAFMGQLDASIVTLTYPALQRELGASFGSVEWVSLAYLLTVAVLLVPVGRLADARGRKLLYLYGFGVFTLGSWACALAPTLGWLVASRVAQGAGAALLQANSVALVTTSVRPRQIRSALGVQAGAQALGLAVGPTVGGLLVESAGWRAVFWINVPVGVVALVLGRLLLPRSRNLRPPAAPDRWGVVLLGVTASGTLLALSAVSGLPLPPAVTVVAVLAAAAAAAALPLVERRAGDPVLAPEVLHVPGVRRGLLGALAAYLVLFAPLVLYPPVLTDAGMSEGRAGLVLSALPAGFAFAAVGAGLMLPRELGNRARVVGAGALAALVLLGLAAAGDRPVPVAVLLAGLGVCIGVLTPANNATVMSGVPPTSVGLAGGLINVARALGTSLGVALTVLGLHLAGAVGVAPATLVCTGLALVAALAGATAVRR